MSEYKKYLKYKQKYLELKNQIGGLTQLKINITDGVIKPLENGSLDDLEFGRYKLKELVPSTLPFPNGLEKNHCKIFFNKNIPNEKEIKIIRFSDADSILNINKEIQLKDIDNGDYIIYKSTNEELGLDEDIENNMYKFESYPKAMVKHYLQLKEELSKCEAKLKGKSPKPRIIDFTDI